MTGTPTIALNSGGSASYSSGTGTGTLTFNYTTGAGDNAADLDYSATTSLLLSGGTIKDAATNNATLTLPAVGGASSIGGQKAIVVDTTAPTVASVSSSTANGAYQTAQTIAVTITFSEPVTVTGTPKLTLNTAPSQTADYASGSGSSTLTFNYTVQAGDTAADLDYAATNSLALNGGTIKDTATNNATLTLPTVGGANSLGGQKNLVIDTTNPTATVTTPAGNGNTYNTTSLPGNLAGSSADTSGSGVSSVQIAIQDGAGNYWGGTTFNQASITYNATGGTTGAWTYATTTLAGQLTNTHTYTITARSTDNAGNTGTTTRTFVYDATSPTVTNVTSTKANGAYPAGTLIPVTVTFSESVDVTGSPTIALNSGGTATYSSGTGSATLTFNYTTGAGDNAADLDYSTTGSLALSGGTIKDSATNAATLTLPAVGGASSIGGQKAIQIDTANPTVSVTTPAASGNPYNATSLAATLAGSSADTGGSGVSTVQIAIQDGSGNYWGGATFNQASISYNATGGTTAAWTYTTPGVAQLIDGHTYTITARSTDAAGNTGTAIRTFVYDTTGPTVSSVGSLTGDGAYRAGQAVTITVAFSESVTVTGSPTLALNSGGSASYSGGFGTTLQFTYNIGAGENTADLDYATVNSLAFSGGTIKDTATNNATLTLPTIGGPLSLGGQLNIVVDTTNPTASVTTPASNGVKLNASSLPGSISGGAADVGSGVSTVQVAIQDGAGNFWGGATFNQASIFYNAASGTTAWTYSTATLAGLLTDGHTYTITARSTDAAGNTGTSTRTFVYDTTPPTVTNISASNANGVYTTGATIHVQVTFSEAVTVTGTPKIGLNAGQTADYVSGSGTSALTFDYAVQAGDNVANLEYNATNSLVLNSGTIKDAATNNATLTLPTPGAAGSLSANKNIRIDTTAPTVASVSASNSNGAYRAGDTINLQLTFSESVDVTGTPKLTLNTAPSQTADYASGSGSSTLTFNYTVQAGDTAADLDYAATNSLALNGGTIKDTATNNATLTLPTVGGANSLGGQKNLVIDTTNPTATVTTPAGNGNTYNTTSLPGNLAGSSADTSGSGVSSVQIAIQDGAGNYWGGTTFNQASITYNATGGTTGAWTYATTTLAGQLTNTHTYTITARSTDNAGNTGTASRTLVYDSTAPTVTNVTASNANGSYKAGDIIHMQIAFSDPVDVTGAPQLTLNTVRTADYASGTGSSTLTFDYTVQAGDNIAALDYSTTGSLIPNGGTIKDAATNGANLILPAPGAAGSLAANKNIRIDTANPTATVAAPASNGNSYNGSSLPGSLAGSSADTGGSGVSTVQIAIQDGSGNYWGGATFNQASISYNATGGTTAAWTYATATLVAQLSDNHTYTITARATDTAGNTGTTTRTFVHDTTAPTVSSVTASNTDGAFTTGEVIHVRVTFDEPMTVTGTPKLTLNTTPSRTADYTSGSGTSTLTFDYTIQAGDLSADLDYATTGSLVPNGGTLRDSATNNALLTLPTVGGGSSLGGQKNLEIDTTAPAVDSVSASNADGSYKTGQTIQVVVTFSKPVTLTGGTPTLDLNTAPARSATYASGSGGDTFTFDYTVQAGDTSSRLDAAAANAIHLNGATIRDAAANDAVTTVATGSGTTGALANAKDIVIDTTASTVTNVTSTPLTASYKTGDTVHVTVSFSEPVNVTGNPTLALNTGQVATYVSGSGAMNLTFDYTVQSGDTASPLAYTSTGSLVLAGGTIRDPATNNAALTLVAPGSAGSLNANTAITIDTTAPTVSGITASNPDGAFKAGDVVHVQISFDEQVDVTGTPTLALSNGGTATYVSGSGTSTLAFDYTVQAGDTSSRLDAASTSALGGGTIRDGATNDATLTVATGQGTTGALADAKNIRIDTTDPTETIAAPASNGTTYNAAFLPASIAGSSADSGGSGVGDVKVAVQDGTGNYWNGATFGSGSIAYNATGGTTGAWTYSTSTLVGQLADNHTYTITARATDAAGNQSTTTRTFVFDVAIPSVTNVTASNIDGAYTVGDTIHVEIAFNKTVTVTGTPKLTLNTSPSRTADFSSGSGTPTLTFDYVVQAGDNAATLDYAAAGSLTVNGGTIRDAATNDAALALPAPGAANSLSANKSLRIDTTAPTVVSAAVAADGLTVTVTWSESLDQTQAVPGDAFSVNASSGSAAAVTYPTADQTRFTLASAVNHLDTLSLDYTAPGANPKLRDTAGNPGATAAGAAVTNNTDNIAPTAPALLNPAGGLRLNTATPLLTATFNDPDPNDTGTVTFEVCSRQ